jgi:hypothetical protein
MRNLDSAFQLLREEQACNTEANEQVIAGFDSSAPVPFNPPIVFAISPLNATKAMNMARAITSAIDHFDDSRTRNLATRFSRSNDGLYKQRDAVEIFKTGKTTLNISTNTPTIHISGRP